MKEIIGYNCKVCKGKNIREDKDTIVHMCEGFVEPVFKETTALEELNKILSKSDSETHKEDMGMNHAFILSAYHIGLKVNGFCGNCYKMGKQEGLDQGEEYAHEAYKEGMNVRMSKKDAFEKGYKQGQKESDYETGYQHGLKNSEATLAERARCAEVARSYDGSGAYPHAGSVIATAIEKDV